MTHNENLSIQTTLLFDPAIGFLYSTELFEKDLYRGKSVNELVKIYSDSISYGREKQAGRGHL